MNDVKKELYLPVNIPASRAFDYFAGYGAKELGITFVSFVVAMIMAVIVYQGTEQILYSALLGIGLVGMTVLIIKRDKFDESLITQLQIVRKYHKAQKRYEYFYFDIYKNEEM